MDNKDIICDGAVTIDFNEFYDSAIEYCRDSGCEYPCDDLFRDKVRDAYKSFKTSIEDLFQTTLEDYM